MHFPSRHPGVNTNSFPTELQGVEKLQRRSAFARAISTSGSTSRRERTPCSTEGGPLRSGSIHPTIPSTLQPPGPPRATAGSERVRTTDVTHTGHTPPSPRSCISGSRGHPVCSEEPIYLLRNAHLCNPTRTQRLLHSPTSLQLCAHTPGYLGRRLDMHLFPEPGRVCKHVSECKLRCLFKSDGLPESGAPERRPHTMFYKNS